MRVPWGLIVLLVLVGDAVSLWMLYGFARDGGYGVLMSLLATIAYVVATFFVGVSVLVSGPVNAMRSALRTGVAPKDVGRRVLNGVLAIAAAVLLMIPGVVSDALAVLFLFPPTRALFRPLARRGAVVQDGGSRVTFGYARHWGTPGRAHQQDPRARGGDEPAMDVDRDEYRVE